MCIKKHFLRKIDELNLSGRLRGKNITHVSINVVNMFPNIPREFGIAECTKHLNNRPKPHLLSTNCIVEALKITLDNNLATFSGQCYLQLSGTAMAPRMLVTMQMWLWILLTKQCITTILKQFQIKIFQRIGIVFGMMCMYPGQELWSSWSVSWSGWIVFILVWSLLRLIPRGIDFLDLYVYSNENNILQTKLYSKPSDTHRYLVPSSCHRTHIVENIPYNTARRILVNNSKIQNYIKDKKIYSVHLITRGYSPEFVKEAF